MTAEGPASFMSSIAILHWANFQINRSALVEADNGLYQIGLTWSSSQNVSGSGSLSLWVNLSAPAQGPTPVITVLPFFDKLLPIKQTEGSDIHIINFNPVP